MEVETPFVAYKYEGSFDPEGFRSGKGRAYFSNGDSYEGEYQEGLRHGYGKYTFARGGVYEGNWSCGMKHGKGKFTYCDGTYYDGEFFEDMRQGYGKYEYSNSDTYQGYWMSHKRNGFGCYVYFQAGIKFEGEWKDGYRTNIGQLTLLDGNPVPELIDHPQASVSVRCDELASAAKKAKPSIDGIWINEITRSHSNVSLRSDEVAKLEQQSQATSEQGSKTAHKLDLSKGERDGPAKDQPDARASR